MEWVLLATQVAGFGFLLYLYLTLRPAAGAEGRRPDGSAEGAELRETVEQLIEQLRQTTDEISRELEDRSNWLQVLMTEADRKLEALDLAASPPPGGSEPRTARPRLPVEVRRQVVELAEQGLSSWEIAQRTKMGREEVDLLLKLHDRNQR